MIMVPLMKKRFKSRYTKDVPPNSAVCLFLAALIITACVIGCGPKEMRISGETMGTVYHIKIVHSKPVSVVELQRKIDRRLEEINQSMSTYRKDSEISRFNAINDTNTIFPISADFSRVLGTAARLHLETGGAWDGAVNPLLDLWGFRNKKENKKIPSADEIQAALSYVGFDRIEIIDSRRIRKKHPGVTLDFASIAKGYGVDQIAALIQRYGFFNFSVEIGGEVYVSGLNKNHDKWRIGINTPEKTASPYQVYTVVEMSDKAVATSGDYRNYIESGGVSYSHIIDPESGYPVSNGVASVSVLADNCMFADGLATALMVMGPESGIDAVEKLSGVECLIIVQTRDGKPVDYASSGFAVSDK